MVDEFLPNPSDPQSSAFARGARVMTNGTVIAVGGGNRGDGTGGQHYVRKSHLSSLGTWTTLDAYQPFSFSEGFGSAWANDVTIGRFGRIFTSGTENEAGSDFYAAISRQGNSDVSSFIRSDYVIDPATITSQHEFVYAGGIDTLANFNILAGHVQDRGGSKSWMVRKMSCNL
ncbi:MAG TPA: hypothetical protein VNJ08_04280 [Bacteriovoracaceae bacterium]|nr:hypothetical protein [Bacteriovoracaceae bacterium]